MNEKRFYNGVPWFDRNRNTVNAHGGCILKEGDKYYLFGEYKTDDENKYIGFSCYSTIDFVNWNFEGLALPIQKDGLLGPDRVGERVKVLKCPKTGKYVMFMHTDDLKYCDPVIGLGISERIDGEFTFIGPILYKGSPIKMWDMGTFVDDDGKAYLMTHEGDIYLLSDDYTEAVEKVVENIAPGGESPAMFKKDGIYFIMFSNKTSWERNDNYYLTAKSIDGSWEYKGLFCPEGSFTYNSQCSFVFDYYGDSGRIPVYIGDRWSFPKQASAATLVLLPIQIDGDGMKIENYMSIWSPDDLLDRSPRPHNSLDFNSNVKGESCEIKFKGSYIMVFGETFNHGGYGNFDVYDEKGNLLHESTIDFYSRIPNNGLRYTSPKFKEGYYSIKITVTGSNGIWFDKKGTRFGSDNYFVKLSGWSVF